MKLYVTMTSPYARMARIAMLEHRLENRVEVIQAATRQTDSPYYRINVSGRVPFLVLEDGRGLEESDVICRYFDSIGDGPALCRTDDTDDWAFGQLHARARSLLDGLAVWVRELRRPENERSPTIVAHEKERAVRLLDYWDREVSEPLMRAPLNLVHITLVAAIDAAKGTMRNEALAERTRLADWYNELSERPSVAVTHPRHA